MEDYYEVEWYVCKKIYIHKSIDRDFLESEKVYKEILFEGDANTLEEDYEAALNLSSVGIIKNMNLMDALEYAYDYIECATYPDEEEGVEIFLDKIKCK